MKKILYTLLGIGLAITSTVWAIGVSVPQSTGQGTLPIGLTTGNYVNGNLVAGANILIGTSTPGQINISAINQGVFIYYFYATQATSSPAYFNMNSTASTTKSTVVYSGINSTQILQNFISPVGSPGLTSIPQGAFQFHVHVSSTNPASADLYAELWEVSSTGVDIGKIGTTETTATQGGLSTTETEYALAFSTSVPYNMASVSSRLVVKVWLLRTAGTHNVSLYIGDGSDTRFILPSNTVDATNFVPYTGATKTVDLGSQKLVTLGNVGIGTTNPGEKLEVSGAVANTAGINANVKNTDSSGITRIKVTNDAGKFAMLAIGGSLFSGDVGLRNNAIYSTDNSMFFMTDHNSANGGTGSLNFMTGGFTTATQVRMKIDSAGNVGIGTTAPTQALDVNGKITLQDGGVRTLPAGLTTEVNSSMLEFGINEGSGNRFGTYVQANQGGMFRFDGRAGNPLLQIYGRTAGVASGAGSILWQIASDGTVTGNGNQGINGTLSVTGAVNGISYINAGTAGGFAELYLQDAGTIKWQIGKDNNNNLRIYNNAGSATAMEILNNGNVGIGTTSPGATLDVNGSIRAFTSTGRAYQQVAGTAGTYTGLYAGLYSDTRSRIGFELGASDAPWIFFGPGGSSSYDAGISRSVAGKLYIGNGTQGDYSGTLIAGNVGIGTTSPAQKLTIAGDIGHYGTIPTLTSCGTSPTITVGSTDSAGEITEGTIATNCTLTFAVAKTNAPFCVVTMQSGLAASYVTSASAITITNIGALSGTKINYNCVANNK